MHKKSGLAATEEKNSNTVSIRLEPSSEQWVDIGFYEEGIPIPFFDITPSPVESGFSFKKVVLDKEGENFVRLFFVNFSNETIHINITERGV